MPFIFRILKVAPALAAGANNPLYTVGAAPTTSAIVSNIRFNNTNSASATAVLIYRSATAGTPSNFAKVTVPGSSSALYNTEITLAQGNIIEVSNSATLDVNVFGVERTS